MLLEHGISGLTMFIIFRLMLDYDAVKIQHWNGDGQCDDINNINTTGFDGGDCCRKDSVKQFCFDCSCKSNPLDFRI